MHIVAAGASSGKLQTGKPYAELCEEHGLWKLYSHYDTTERSILNSYEYCSKVLVDSGGHVMNAASGLNKLGFKKTKPPRPAKLEIENYLRFMDKHKEASGWIVVEPDFYGQLPLDYISGVAREVRQMKPKFTYIRVYHPGIKEDGGSLKVLKQWIDEGYTYLGISKSAEKYYADIFKITRNDIKLHGFALTGKTVLEQYPFYSADSTTTLVVPIKYKSIPDGNGSLIAKPTALKNKDIRYLHYLNDDKRIIESIRQTKQRETYYTKLWAARGIVWVD